MAIFHYFPIQDILYVHINLEMVHTKYSIDLIYGLVNLTHIKLSKITIVQIEDMKDLLSLKEKQHFFWLIRNRETW